MKFIVRSTRHLTSASLGSPLPPNHFVRSAPVCCSCISPKTADTQALACAVLAAILFSTSFGARAAQEP